MADDDFPLEQTTTFLAAHKELQDTRLYALLLFNAFDETMLVYLAWRLGCSRESLPGAVKNNASLLFDFVLPGLSDLRRKARAFSEARNAVAHHFHEDTYEEKLAAIVMMVSDKPWPSDRNARHRAVADAVQYLSLEVAFAMQDLPPRTEAPFPQLPSELKWALDERLRNHQP